MPEFTIGQDRVDFDQLRLALQAELEGRDSWNDILDAATGQIILDFFAAVGAFNQQAIHRALQEVFFDTQNRPTSSYRLARSHGIHINRKIPAQVTVNLANTDDTVQPSSVVRLIPNSQFSINGIDFFNRNEIDLIGNTVTQATLFQGTRVTLNQQDIVLGQRFQRFTIGNPDFAISDFFVGGVGDIHAIIGSQRFNMVRNGLWHYTENDLVFYENTTADGRVELLFGNGTYGALPPSGESEIQFVYIETLGAAGNSNVAVGTTVSSSNPNISGTTTSMITGGEDEKEAAFYKRFGSDIYSSRRRAVTRNDYRALILEYPGILDVLVEGQQDIIDESTRQVAGIAASGNRLLTIDRLPPDQSIPRLLAIALSGDTPGVFPNGIPSLTQTVRPYGLTIHGTVVDIIDNANRSIVRYQSGQDPRGYSLLYENSDPRDIHSHGTITRVVDGTSAKVFGYVTVTAGAASSSVTPDTSQDINLITGSIEVDIIDSGSGYQAGDSVTIGPPPSTGTQAMAILDTNDIDDQGGIIRLTFTVEGAGYDPNNPPAVMISGSGQGAAIGARVVANNPTGIWFDDTDIYIAYRDSRKIHHYNRSTQGIRRSVGNNYGKDINLVAENTNPVALTATLNNARNPLQLYVSDDSIENNQIYIYDIPNRVFSSERIDLARPGRRNPRYMNVIRLTLLTRQQLNQQLNENDRQWTDAQWEQFIGWLRNRAIATTEYQRRNSSTVPINIDVDVFCFERVTLDDAQDLIESRVRDLFVLQEGVLGRSYYRSNLYTFIESIRDGQGPIVDYLNFNEPTEDQVIQRHEYLELSNLVINVRYTNRVRVRN